jgi:hypothetical protein
MANQISKYLGLNWIIEWQWNLLIERTLDIKRKSGPENRISTGDEFLSRKLGLYCNAKYL